MLRMYRLIAHRSNGSFHWTGCATPRRVATIAAALLVIVATPRLVLAQGALVAWGADSFGVVSNVPAGTFVAVAAGAGHAVAVRDDGTLVSWGNDWWGQVSGTPSGTFTAAAAGEGHSVAIRTDGTLISWGSDQLGQVSGTPSGTFVAVAAAAWYSIAIRTDGTLVGWGADFNYWDGNPVPAGAFSAIAAGPFHRLAIRTDGSLMQIGGYLPPPVPPGTFSAVAAGAWHNVAIRTDGTLFSWDTGGAVIGTPAGTFTAVAASDSHSVAIRTDGTLVSWGGDDRGQVSGTPTGTYSAVAASPSDGDLNGAFYAFSVAIAAADNQPPVITCNAPVVLGSPNHELVDVSSAFSVDDPDGDVVEVSIRVYSDETEIPDTGDGTGRHAPDYKTQLASGATGHFVRSERRGTEDGRFYIGVITAVDGYGGVTTQVCVLAVCPHDQNSPASLEDVLNQATAAAIALDFPARLHEHGLSEPLGVNQ